MSINVSVDLSATLGKVRYQDVRPTCLAFALSELHRHAAGLAPLLSPEYLYRAAANLMPNWVPGAGLNLYAGCHAIKASGQPLESHCTYVATEPVEKPPLVPNLGTVPIYQAAQCAFALPDLAALVTALKAGRPVGVVVRMTDTFMKPAGGIVAYSDVLVPTSQNHAVIAAGVGAHVTTSETHILVRNTWGPAWGNDGSAWIPVRYVHNHALATFEVQ